LKSTILHNAIIIKAKGLLQAYMTLAVSYFGPSRIIFWP